MEPQGDFEVTEARALVASLDERRRAILLQACWEGIDDRDLKVEFLQANNLVGENDIEDFE